MRKVTIGSALAAILGLAAHVGASAAQVDVSYTLSGSAGNWSLDFQVTNDISSTNSGLIINEFGVAVPGASPPFFLSPSGWNDGPFTGVAVGTTTYTETTTTNVGVQGIVFSQTKGGFTILDTQTIAPTNIKWFAMASSPGGTSVYTGPTGENVQTTNPLTNPIFIGTDTSPVPLPAAAWLFLTGAALIGALALPNHRRLSAVQTEPIGL